MSDIVEQLRDAANGGGGNVHWSAIMRQASNAIESLRQRVKLLEQGIASEKDLSRTLMIELRTKK